MSDAAPSQSVPPAQDSTAEIRARAVVPYLPGLDGLRAIAVVAVIFYHANHSWLRGGFLGVEVFFVISGYLITLLLLAAQRAHQSARLLAASRTTSVARAVDAARRRDRVRRHLPAR